MGFFSRLFSWFGGADAKPASNATAPFSTRLVKVSIYAKGREASAMELVTVIDDARVQGIFKGLNEKRYHASTEEYNPKPGENDEATVERVAREVAQNFPGKMVHAMPWPGARPLLIVLFVTAPEVDLALAQTFGMPPGAIKIVASPS